MKEIDASIDRGEGGEEKEKERKEKESVYTEIFSILNKNGLGKGKTDLKTIYMIFIKQMEKEIISDCYVLIL